MDNGYEPRPNRVSLVAVAVVAVIVVAGILGNLYTYHVLSTKVTQLENRVATFHTQVDALTAALSNYSLVTIENISLPALYARVKDSVVLIRGETPGGGVAGSGFVYYHTYSDQMVIITNYHVVESTTTRTVTFRNGHAYAAHILGGDAYADLAVLAVEGAAPEEFTPLSIVDSSLLHVGDLVIAVGNPYELVGSMTVGIVSQLGRAVPEDLAGGYAIANVIQISAPLNPGNSGGPLLNAKGQVVGVTFAIVENSTGVGFAVPSNTVLREISWLINGTDYPHSWIGIGGQAMTYERAQTLETATTWGVVIVEVQANSPAAEYGLQVNDIILAINSTQIISVDYISAYLEEHTRPGQTIIITVERGGSEMTVELELGTRPLP